MTVAELIEFLTQFPQDTKVEVQEESTSKGWYFVEFSLCSNGAVTYTNGDPIDHDQTVT